nr:hypothetical protein [uncultured Allomuricauda sp.]
MSIIRGGVGHRRPQLDVGIENLHPDPENPRLPSEFQGKSESEVIEALYKFFHLQELAISMFENGYFDAEPLVAIPQSLPSEFKGKEYQELNTNESYRAFISDPSTHFIVVEGNRRLSTAKLLLSGVKKGLPSLGEEQTWVREDLAYLPIIVYPERKQVLAYIGARHIIGTKKWDAYAKARYIASLKEDHKLSMDDIQRTVGDTGNSARKIYTCYKLIEEVEDEYESIDSSEAKENFSFLVLATGQGSIKDYIGLPKKWKDIDFDINIVPTDKIDNLKQLFLWLFGDGKEVRKIIKESRDITNYLTDILRNDSAVEHLKQTGDILGSFERSGGEDRLVEKYVKRANTNIEQALGMLHRHKTDEIKSELRKLEETTKTAITIVEDA